MDKFPFVTFDLETTIRKEFKKKANPFYGFNRVCAVGVKGKGELRPRGYYLLDKAYTDWWIDLLDSTKLLVGFNIKFDIHHAINQSEENYIKWCRWVTAGGRVWDCQLAEYLLGGQAQDVQMTSLDKVAVKYGGNVKNDAVKALWESGVDTPDIPKSLLMDYLVGVAGDPNDLGDIGNTEKVFIGQVQALRARGSMKSVQLNMDALIFTIEAEHQGMQIDVVLGEAIRQELELELEGIDKEIDGYFPKDMPFVFNWNSRFHKSALVFGGTVKYEERTAITTDDLPLKADGSNQAYVQMDVTHYVLMDGTTTDVMPTFETAAKYVTFASGKNKGSFKTKKVKVNDPDKPKSAMRDYYYAFPGYTEGKDKWAAAEAGVWGTGKDVIEELSVTTDVPFLKAMGRRAMVAKDLGTYYKRYDPKKDEWKGMLTLVGPDGRIHHSLNMVRTITARLSSSDPNLQNVSSGKKSKVKSIFISRFAGGKIIQSDFTSLEVYVQAVLTLCAKLIEDLRAGMDMHCVRLSQKLGLTYEEVYARYKAGDEEIADGRKGSKEFSFQRAYGAGIAAIAAATGMSVADVEALAVAEETRYPEIPEYYERLTEEIKRNRRPTSHIIPHPRVKGAKCQIGKSYTFTPDGKMYTYIEGPSPDFMAKRGETTSFSPPEIKNYVVQGSGGEWAKAAMKLAVRAFYAKENFGGRAVLVNQVHDAIYVDAAPEVAEDAAALLHACMLEASNLIEFTFDWKVPVGVPSETKWGASMIEENDIGGQFHEKAAEYQRWVRAEFVGGNIPSYEGDA
ncbi:DNA polymerase I [Xanthomonas phage SB3]|uniref:DNA polymerase I n=1 Tax=Xanthomonas phage SB3 TaxID=3117472 RepID=A0ABZ2GYC7_9CAUD